jgi:hypothetical protein
MGAYSQGGALGKSFRKLSKRMKYSQSSYKLTKFL